MPDEKRTLALRVPNSMFRSYEKTARLLGTTNSNLLGILLKHYVETKVQMDFEALFRTQVTELTQGISEINIEDLVAGRMGRPTGQKEKKTATLAAAPPIKQKRTYTRRATVEEKKPQQVEQEKAA